MANTVLTPSAVKAIDRGPMTPAFMTSASTDPSMAAKPLGPIPDRRHP
ncbi:hypothetical protein ACFQ9X_31960 [Catenulispora yoronensis]